MLTYGHEFCRHLDHSDSEFGSRIRHRRVRFQTKSRKAEPSPSLAYPRAGIDGNDSGRHRRRLVDLRDRPGRLAVLRSDRTPEGSRDSPDFARGVDFLCQEQFTPGDLAAYFSGDNAIIACLAAEALSRRDDGAAATEDLLASIGTVAPWAFYFALRSFTTTAPPETPIMGRVLARAVGLLDNRMARAFLEEFVRDRMSAGEVLRLGNDFEELSETDIGVLRQFLELIDDRVPGKPIETFRRWMEERIDRRLLESIGSVWNPRHIEQTRKSLDHEALERRRQRT